MKNRKQKTRRIGKAMSKWRDCEAQCDRATDEVLQRREDYLYSVCEALLSVAETYRFYLGHKKAIRSSSREYQQLSERQMLRRLLDGMHFFHKGEEFFSAFESIARSAEADSLEELLDELASEYG